MHGLSFLYCSWFPPENVLLVTLASHVHAYSQPTEYAISKSIVSDFIKMPRVFIMPYCFFALFQANGCMERYTI